MGRGGPTCKGVAVLLALLLRIQVLGLLHPHSALVWPDGAATAVVARPGESYGKLRVSVEVPGLPRREYAGRLEVRAGKRELLLFNLVGLEDYVASVVGSELGPAAPLAAREALATVARSFALRREHLCDTTHCQLYFGKSVAAPLPGPPEVLRGSRGRIAPALHSAFCGGTTREAREVWPHASADEAEASKRVADGCSAEGRPRQGHAVGLCQQGAIRLATQGRTAHQILSLYFPGLRPLAF
jgi:peptidoglycan hydrolase-like amidase